MIFMGRLIYLVMSCVLHLGLHRYQLCGDPKWAPNEYCPSAGAAVDIPARLPPPFRWLKRRKQCRARCWLATLLMVPSRHFGGAHFGLIWNIFTRKKKKIEERVPAGPKEVANLRGQSNYLKRIALAGLTGVISRLCRPLFFFRTKIFLPTRGRPPAIGTSFF